MIFLYLFFTDIFIYVCLYFFFASIIKDFWINSFDQHLLVSIMGIPVILYAIYNDKSYVYISNSIIINLNKKFSFDLAILLCYFTIIFIGFILGNIVYAIISLFIDPINYVWNERAWYFLSFTLISLFGICLFMTMFLILKRFTITFIAY